MSVLSALHEQVTLLRELAATPTQPSCRLLADLLANAARRAETGRYEDAPSLAYGIDLYFGKSGTLAQRANGDYQTVFKPLLARHHQSILAHGLTPARGVSGASRVSRGARVTCCACLAEVVRQQETRCYALSAGQPSLK